jgi:flagellar motor switch protein FliN/FliY
MNNYEKLLDMELELEVILNEIKIPIKEIKKFEKGTIIDLQIPAGDFAKIKVNNMLLATGEIMVFEKNFGIRISEIIDSEKILSIDLKN